MLVVSRPRSEKEETFSNQPLDGFGQQILRNKLFQRSSCGLPQRLAFAFLQAVGPTVLSMGGGSSWSEGLQEVEVCISIVFYTGGWWCISIQSLLTFSSGECKNNVRGWNLGQWENSWLQLSFSRWKEQPIIWDFVCFQYSFPLRTQKRDRCQEVLAGIPPEES